MRYSSEALVVFRSWRGPPAALGPNALFVERSGADSGDDGIAGRLSARAAAGNGDGGVSGGGIGTSTVFGAISTAFSSAPGSRLGAGLSAAGISFLKPVGTTCSVGTEVKGASAIVALGNGAALVGICRATCGLRIWNSRTAELPH